jgi:hypothetical protein
MVKMHIEMHVNSVTVVQLKVYIVCSKIAQHTGHFITSDSA